MSRVLSSFAWRLRENPIIVPADYIFIIRVLLHPDYGVGVKIDHYPL